MIFTLNSSKLKKCVFFFCILDNLQQSFLWPGDWTGWISGSLWNFIRNIQYHILLLYLPSHKFVEGRGHLCFTNTSCFLFDWKLDQMFESDTKIQLKSYTVYFYFHQSFINDCSSTKWLNSYIHCCLELPQNLIFVDPACGERDIVTTICNFWVRVHPSVRASIPACPGCNFISYCYIFMKLCGNVHHVV